MEKEKIIVKVDSELQEIVPGFVTKRKNEISLLRESFQKSDFSTLSTLGHRLKGNAGGYGFDYLGTLGADLESGANAKDTKKIETTLQKLEDYLSRLEVVFVEIK